MHFCSLPSPQHSSQWMDWTTNTLLPILATIWEAADSAEDRDRVSGLIYENFLSHKSDVAFHFFDTPLMK